VILAKVSDNTFNGASALNRSLSAAVCVTRQTPAFLIVCLLFGGPGLTQADEKPFGIDKRVAWSTSRMVGMPEPPSPYVLERVFPQLTFKNPVELLPVPGTDRMLVVEVDGRILSFSQSGNPVEADVILRLRFSSGFRKQSTLLHRVHQKAWRSARDERFPLHGDVSRSAED
jgi:hypothetical protein